MGILVTSDFHVLLLPLSCSYSSVQLHRCSDEFQDSKIRLRTYDTYVNNCVNYCLRLLLVLLSAMPHSNYFAAVVGVKMKNDETEKRRRKQQQ